MENTWIIDVIGDLRTFAAQNGLPKLADQLDDTALIAAAEMSAKRKREAGENSPYAKELGAHNRSRAASGNAGRAANEDCRTT